MTPPAPRADNEDVQSVELTNPIFGSAKVSGATVNTIFSVFGFVLLMFCAFVLWNHQVEAKDGGKEVAAALKESNKEIAQALKENNAAVTEAIKQMAAEQKRANEIGREQTCLLTLPPDRRTNAGDFCKRLSRERDR